MMQLLHCKLQCAKLISTQSIQRSSDSTRVDSKVWVTQSLRVSTLVATNFHSPPINFRSIARATTRTHRVSVYSLSHHRSASSCPTILERHQTPTTSWPLIQASLASTMASARRWRQSNALPPPLLHRRPSDGGRRRPRRSLLYPTLGAALIVTTAS